MCTNGSLVLSNCNYNEKIIIKQKSRQDSWPFSMENHIKVEEEFGKFEEEFKKVAEA